MTKVEAVKVLIGVGCTFRITREGHRKLLKALDALGLDMIEMLAVEQATEYRDSLGKLHPALRRVKP